MVRTGRPLSPASNKRLCNRYSKPFFPIVAYHLCKVALIGAGQKIRGALAAGRVHAHVQRAVEAKAEAARRVVDLRRANAQVEQHAVDLRRCRAPASARRMLREAGVMDREARVLDACIARARRRHRVRVAVEGDQPARARQPRQQRARVAAAAEGAVDVDAVGVRDERVDRFVQQDGGVRWPWRRRSSEDEVLIASGIRRRMTSASCAA